MGSTSTDNIPAIIASAHDDDDGWGDNMIEGRDVVGGSNKQRLEVDTVGVCRMTRMGVMMSVDGDWITGGTEGVCAADTWRDGSSMPPG
nr:hypothetical protein CFP56_62858 [Quercus suber]